MKSVKAFKYTSIDAYSFEELPKGNMLEIVMNPYNGNVFIKPGKNSASCLVALDVMREVVSACDVLERQGSADPLRDYHTLCEVGIIDSVLSDAARADYRAFEGGKKKNAQVIASAVMEKAI